MPTTSEIADRLPHSAELLTGRVMEYGQLQATVAERPGLLVVTSDPWSGTSPMLRSVLEDLEHPAILVDARRCRDAIDLAMAIADRAISAYAPAAEPWWMSSAPPLADERHPLYRAGVRLRISRAQPSRFVTDLAITRGWTKVPVDLIGAAAELANGVPALAWSIVKLAPTEPDFLSTRAFEGWQELRRLTAPTTAHQWELLRRVHPLAQPIIAAMSVGMRPHSIGANSKSVNEGLKRLREVGLAWRTEKRYWALADPLLAAWARDHAAPWAQRKSQLASTASTVRSDG